MTRSPVKASCAQLRSSTTKNNGRSVSLLTTSSSLWPRLKRNLGTAAVTSGMIPSSSIWHPLRRRTRWCESDRAPAATSAQSCSAHAARPRPETRHTGWCLGRAGTARPRAAAATTARDETSARLAGEVAAIIDIARRAMRALRQVVRCSTRDLAPRQRGHSKSQPIARMPKRCAARNRSTVSLADGVPKSSQRQRTDAAQRHTGACAETRRASAQAVARRVALEIGDQRIEAAAPRGMAASCALAPGIWSGMAASAISFSIAARRLSPSRSNGRKINASQPNTPAHSISEEKTSRQPCLRDQARPRPRSAGSGRS